MANIAKYKESRTWGEDPEVTQLVYDFAVDAGAVAALGVMKVKDACVVRNCYFKVNTTCTSGGSATVSLGVSGDAAGLIAATAVASLVAGAVIDSAAFGTGYKLAADAVINMDTAVAALTAGKITVVLEIAKF